MVLVDKEKCIGCGSCAAICGDVFEMIDGADGTKAHVRSGANDSKPCVKDAIDICPTQAIS